MLSIIIIVILLFLFSSHFKESFNIVGMENAYSNLQCVSPDLPVVKVSNNNIACISPTKNASDCLKLSDFSLPSNYNCSNMDTYITKDGLRDINSTSRKLFDNLMKNGYYAIECNAPALNDSSHWCSKLKTSINTTCNSSNNSPICNPSLINSSNNDSPVTITNYSNDSFTSRSTKCSKVYCPRQRVVPKKVCESNCSLCGDTTCPM